jgi:hypothetical protein
LVRTLAVVALDEPVELGLLLQEVFFTGGLVACRLPFSDPELKFRAAQADAQFAGLTHCFHRSGEAAEARTASKSRCCAAIPSSAGFKAKFRAA